MTLGERQSTKCLRDRQRLLNSLGRFARQVEVALSAHRKG